MKMEMICFGGEDWWYHNRGHIDMQLMRRFSKEGKVLFINSLVMQKLSLKNNSAGGPTFWQKLRRKTKSIRRGLVEVSPNFWVYSPISFPVYHSPFLSRINQHLLYLQIKNVLRKTDISYPWIWVACPVAASLIRLFRKRGLIYQRTDRFEDYPNCDRSLIKSFDKKLKMHSDITFYVNTLMYNNELRDCKNAYFIDHGVDYDLFDTPSYVPEEILDIPRPIAGYFGALDTHKLDPSFLTELSRKCPGISFVFVGSYTREFEPLQEETNVWLLGQKTYEEVPNYGNAFDISILPWRYNDWTNAANPIKLKEYLALGKPVISTTAFSEINRYSDVIYLAENVEDFASRIHQALEDDSIELRIIRKNKVRKFSWDKKAQEIRNLLSETEKKNS